MLVLSIWLSLSSCVSEVISLSCGIDNSPISHVYEGIANIETYPWLGVLYYPYNGHKFTTAVVLVTRQIVLAAANEVDKLPKDNFRSLARVIIGHKCNGTSIGIRDYTYHPDYSRSTFSALAMIQLEVDHATIKLRPICPPPSHFKDESFFAMILSDNCKRSKVRLHKMKYVSPEQCKNFYRRSDLDVDTMWPSHTACAKSVSGGHCVWRSGAILVVKVGTRWRLLGFGVYGPGCQAPARFLDYGMYHKWVQRSVERIGRPAITTLADNHIVMRRRASHVQRFGPCDQEEQKYELYSEETQVIKKQPPATMKRNVTIVAAIEYSCIVFKAEYDEGTEATLDVPKLKVRRWCSSPGPRQLCYQPGYVDIYFSLELYFEKSAILRVCAFGSIVAILDPSVIFKYLYNHIPIPEILDYDTSLEVVKKQLKDKNFPAFGKNMNAM